MTSSAPSPRKSFLKVLLPAVVIIALIVIALNLIKHFAGRGASNGGDTVSVQMGTTLPDFQLTRVDGSSTHVSELSGKVFLINFWASWCEACIEEMPSIVALRNKFKDQGFEVLGINVDENPAAVIPKMSKELKMEFPIFVDSGGSLSDLFDVHAIPLTVIIDRSRKILYVHGGEKNWIGTDIQGLMRDWLK